jgi:uncharacterized Fe-S cluster-containing radical SAM superfamily enzyme
MSLDERRGQVMAGTKAYSVEHVKDVARMLAKSKIDVLLAPVWVPGFNDEDIPKIIEFGQEIGAGKKYPPFGIQNYVRYQFGKKVKSKPMKFGDFFEKLGALEKQYNLKLKLSPADFGIHREPALPKVFKTGDRLKLEIAAPGRVNGEMLAVANGRVIGVITDRPVGARVSAEITRTTDNIYVARTGEL